MKKLLCFLCMMAVFLPLTKACDICGCGIGSYYTGILPEFRKNIFGLRYRYNSLRTHLGPGGITSYLTTNEKFNTIDIWGGWNIGKKFRLMGYVPYNFNERINQGIHTKSSGPGDLGLQVFYNLINAGKTMGNDPVLHSLWIGGGIKLPTGTYDPAQKDGSAASANTFQLGTGTVDFTLNLMYDLRIRDFGVNTTANYKMNTTNKEKYQYGNKLSSAIQAYYKIRVKRKVTIAPNVGIAYETAARDNDNKFIVDASGGNILSQTTGVEISFKNIAVGASRQVPLEQHLANDLVKAGNRLMVHISFML
jgi:hypothetical protein